jgi:hypothetical protein
MTELASPNETFEFPPRKDQVKAQWMPIYIEPVIGSGERIAVGVAVANSTDFLVVQVAALDRLRCLYGAGNDALLFAADSVLASMRTDLAKSGISALGEWVPPVEGAFTGHIRNGAGRTLKEIAKRALTLCSSLVDKLAESEEAEDRKEGISESRLEKLVKEKVILQRPGLEQAFGRTFRPNPQARASKIGFVGQTLAANFSLLTPIYLAQQVKNAKAKLWDLVQVQEYVQKKEFDLSGELHRFELFLHRVREDDPQYSDRQIESIQEAVNELETEADRKEIRCRALRSPDEIARIIIEAEAA